MQPGDVVLSRDESDPEGRIEARVVEETFQRTGRIWLLRLENGQVIRTTPEHPFFPLRTMAWTPTAELQAGDVLRGETGDVRVEAIEDTGEYASVYNCRVAEWHTYFVGCDEAGVWAHNRYDIDDAINATREADVFYALQRGGMSEAEARALARLGAADGTNGQALQDAIARGEITANYAVDKYDAVEMANWTTYRRNLEGQIIPPGYAETPTTGHVGGRRPDSSHDPDPLNRMATQRENEAADVFAAQHGYDVHQQPTVLGHADPDYIVRGVGFHPSGEIFDAFAPQRLNWNNIWSTVEGKVNRQAENIVLIVDDIGATNAQVLSNFTGAGDIPRMRSLWVKRGNDIQVLIDRR